MAADPYFDYVQLLLSGSGTNGSTDIYDSSKYGTAITLTGDVQISTAQSKFGGSSIYFDGTGDMLSITELDDLQRLRFGGKTFCIDFWLYRSGTNANSSRLWNDNGDSYLSGVAMSLDGSGNCNALCTSTGSSWNIVNSTKSITGSTWTHIALTRESSGSMYFYIDGTRGSAVATGFVTDVYGVNSAVVVIGNQTVGDSRPFNGYLEDFRVTIGHPRYTGDFTPPTTKALAGAATITGNITESLPITKWRISASKCSSGDYAGIATSTGSSYSINISESVPVVLTCAPYFDYTWVTGITAVVDEYCVPSDPDTTPHLFKCTTGGAVGGTEPSWNTTISATTSDGSAVWTCIGPLVDPISLGPKIPS